jgi:hypothetical protein
MSDEGLERHSLRRPEPTQGQVESPRWRRPPPEASGFGAPRLSPAPPGPSRGAPPAPLGSLSDRRILRVPGARANAASLHKWLPPPADGGRGAFHLPGGGPLSAAAAPPVLIVILGRRLTATGHAREPALVESGKAAPMRTGGAT